MECPLCFKDNSELFIDLGLQPFTHIFNINNNFFNRKESLQVSFCNNCGHFFNSNPLNSNFKEEYSFLSSSSKTLVKESELISEKLIKVFKKFYSINPSLILEIASNDGCLIDQLEKKSPKSKVIGIEPSLLAYKYSIAKGHNVINDYFNFANSEKILNQINGRPDLIIARNVITHIQDIKDFFKGIGNIISKKTLIYLQSHYWPALIKNVNFDAIYHENYQYFTINSLKNLLEEFNINILEVYFSNSQGGSFSIVASSNSSLEKVNSKKIEEKEIDFYKSLPKKIFDFKKSLINYKNNFSNFLEEQRSLGIKVFGYGAPQKVVVLLNYFQINVDNISLIADISKEKQNKFIPGTNIKICDPKLLIDLNAEIIIVFAWNYYDEIKKQLISMGSNATILSIESFK